MGHVRYIDKTREYYLSQGYAKPYRWANFKEVPFTPLKKPLAESRLALVTTSEIALRTWDDQRTPLEKGEAGNVYSFPSDTPIGDLYSQSRSFDKYATTLADVNAYFPVTRLQEMQAAGRFASLAPSAHGVYNAYSQRRTRESDAPELLRRIQDEAVDVVLLTPLCPVCHQTVSLVARHLEDNGVPTVIMGTARDIVEHCGVARLVFSDFPLGSPCGEPGKPETQTAIVATALDLLEMAQAPRTTLISPFTWPAGEAWKDKVFTKEQPWKDAEVEKEWLEKKALYRELRAQGKV